MKEEKRMLEMLNKMWIGATCRLHNFVEDFKHEEKRCGRDRCDHSGDRSGHCGRSCFQRKNHGSCK